MNLFCSLKTLFNEVCESMQIAAMKGMFKVRIFEKCILNFTPSQDQRKEEKNAAERLFLFNSFSYNVNISDTVFLSEKKNPFSTNE